MFADLPKWNEFLKTAELFWGLNTHTTKQKGRLRAKLRVDYELYKKIKDGRKNGESKLSLARKYRISDENIRCWENGGLPVSIRGFYKSNLRKVYDIPRRTSSDFAYFLGVSLSTMEADTVVKQKLQFSRTDDYSFEKVKDVLTRLFGEDSFQVRLREGSEEINFASNQMFRYLHEITDGYKSLPWEHLQTDREKLAFIRGFFTSLGLNYMQDQDRVFFRINRRLKKERVPLLEDLGLLLFDFGIHSTLFLDRPTKIIEIRDIDDIKFLLDNDCIPERHKDAARKTAELPGGWHKILEAYVHVKTIERLGSSIKGFNKGKALDDTIESYGLNREQVRRWVKGTYSPDVAQKDDKLRALRLKRGVTAIIPYLYKEYNFTSAEARDIASNYSSMQSLEDAINLLRERGIPETEFYSWLKRGVDVQDDSKNYSEEKKEVTQTVSNKYLDFMLQDVPTNERRNLLSLSIGEIHRRLDEEKPIKLRVNGTEYTLRHYALERYLQAFDVDLRETTLGECFEHIRENLPENLPERSKYSKDDLVVEFVKDSSGKPTSIIKTINVSLKYDKAFEVVREATN